MNAKPELIELDGWTVKVSIPEGEGLHPVILMLHGWTGSEDSMWVFAPQLSANAMVIAPRAPHASTHSQYGGYSWVNQDAPIWASLENFSSSVKELDALLEKISQTYPGDFSKITVIGFSQGAAMAYAYSLMHPGRIRKIAGLAGFFPENSSELIEDLPLHGLSAFVAHGNQDERVPLEKARAAEELLKQAGAAVIFCESAVGHKLGANCSKELKAFLIS